MIRWFKLAFILVFLAIVIFALYVAIAKAEEVTAVNDAAHAKALAAQIEKLRPLHAPLGKPKQGEWLLGRGRDEPGQTFQQYLACGPVRPIGQRTTLYIQPLGEFGRTQRRIIDLTADYMGRYFGSPVKVLKDVPLSVVPAKARRTHPTWGDRQVLSTWVLDELLPPRLPADAAACIAFTTSDLWPGEGWNFVFGQASLRERVGVWSIYRNGDPDANEAAFRLCLVRTLKTATHETGHMFSMEHCRAYECNMCGSNHREESDRRPLWCCPECVAKIAWATRSELVPRYAGLLEFSREHGLADEAAMFAKSIQVLGGKVPAPQTTRPKPP